MEQKQFVFCQQELYSNNGSVLANFRTRISSAWFREHPFLSVLILITSIAGMLAEVNYTQYYLALKPDFEQISEMSEFFFPFWSLSASSADRN